MSAEDFARWAAATRAVLRGDRPAAKDAAREQAPGGRSNACHRAVFLYLVDRVFWDNGVAGPGTCKEIAEATGYCERQVKRSIKFLSEIGLIGVERRYGRSGHRMASRYVVPGLASAQKLVVTCKSPRGDTGVMTGGDMGVTTTTLVASLEELACDPSDGKKGKVSLEGIEAARPFMKGFDPAHLVAKFKALPEPVRGDPDKCFVAWVKSYLAKAPANTYVAASPNDRAPPDPNPEPIRIEYGELGWEHWCDFLQRRGKRDLADALKAAGYMWVPSQFANVRRGEDPIFWPCTDRPEMAASEPEIAGAGHANGGAS